MTTVTKVKTPKTCKTCQNYTSQVKQFGQCGHSLSNKFLKTTNASDPQCKYGKTLKTCGKKTDGVRCGLPTNGTQSYCPHHKRIHDRESSARRRRLGDSYEPYGNRDHSILNKVLRRHTERIRRHEHEWDVLPVFNKVTLEVIDVG